MCFGEWDEDSWSRLGERGADVSVRLMPDSPGEGRSVGGGVSRTASRVITLIDTSPHTYTPSPGANQKAAFESRGQA